MARAQAGARNPCWSTLATPRSAPHDSGVSAACFAYEYSSVSKHPVRSFDKRRRIAHKSSEAVHTCTQE
eukprot:7193507-Prymnesium_polylepis.1